MDEHAPEAAAFGSDIVGDITAILQPWRPPHASVSVTIRDLPPEAGVPPVAVRVAW